MADTIVTSSDCRIGGDVPSSNSADKNIVITESEAVTTTPEESSSPPEPDLEPSQGQRRDCLLLRRSSQALSELGSSFEIMDPTEVLLLDPASSPPPGLTSEEDCYEDEMEDTMIQFPDSSKSAMLSCAGLPPRTIPFRSASFSQVDITTEGKYVRNPRSPITLKPTAFCLLNKNPTNSGSRLPPEPPTPPTPTSTATELKSRGGETPPLLLSSNPSSRNSLVSEMKERDSLVCDFPPMATPSVESFLGDSGSDAEVAPSDHSEFKDAESCDPNVKNGEGEDTRVNFTLGGDEESLELIRNNIPVPDSGDFSALAINMAAAGAEDLKNAEDRRSPSLDKEVLTLCNPSSVDTLITAISGAESGGSASSTSGGETESSDVEKGQFIRQSSGQSDGSDEIPALNVSDSCSSPTPPRNLEENPVTTSASDPIVPVSPPTGAYLSTSSPLLNKKEMTRAHSVSNTKYTWGRYNKRPLRGPYGEMLEAEMNKFLPARTTNRDLDNFEFFRESKSSSPNRSTNSHSNSPESGPMTGALGQSNLSSLLPSGSGASGGGAGKKLTSVCPLLMASMDDLNLTKLPKHTNPRSRKISANLPVQTSHFSSESSSTPLVFLHQRTASSPSQLLYTSSPTSTQNPEQTRSMEPPLRLLDGSPRGHVLAEIVETEKSYVDSLQIITKKYMEPLKTSELIDVGLVEEIFSQIPSIMWHHERLLSALQKRIVDDNQCIGDVLLDAFRQNSLLECYSLFVNNWKNAKGSLKMALASKPALARLLEANARQHKGKLNLDSLLIMPIQRIPRYELMVKELLKYTEAVHEDHSRLTLLLEKIKKFALHIDCASVDPNDNRDVEIEGWTAGLGHLIRQDMVTASMNNSTVRKEKALFLFADTLVLAAIKRKGAARKPSALLGSVVGSQWEGCKFKFVMKCQLTDIHLHEEFEPSSSGAAGRSGASSSGSHDDMDDIKVVNRMMDLASTLKCPHYNVDDILKELHNSLRLHHLESNGDPLELEIRNNDSDCPELLKLYFGSAEKRGGWLEAFQNTLAKFVRYGFGKLPQVQLVQALPIRKTRAGLQLSCAAPVSVHNKVSKNLEMSDVWVANSDGYVGQICILTLHPEPAITSCNGVCNSRITCIISVPPAIPGVQSAGVSPVGASGEDHPHHHLHNHNFHSLGYESEDETHKLRAGFKTSEHWTVWLGTEDGGLHVYDCSDSVRVKKNRHKVQHSAPLVCIVYYDSRVFVSLANGDVAVYNRNQNGKGWSIADPSWVTIGSSISPVSKMICVGNTIWCCCGSQVKVYSDSEGILELLQSIQLTIEGNEMPKGVMALVATDDHVWIAIQGSSIIKCYNYITFEAIVEINVGPEVSKMLAGCDDIIRQHKSACLRVTSLLLAPDKKLWIGTSAGVILTMNLTASGERKIVPLPHGHTGQVRFLTCCLNRDSWTVVTGGDGFEEFRTPLLNNNGSGMANSFMGDSSNDTSGREDSTNHLLIWKIPKPM